MADNRFSPRSNSPRSNRFDRSDRTSPSQRDRSSFDRDRSGFDNDRFDRFQDRDDDHYESNRFSQSFRDMDHREFGSGYRQYRPDEEQMDYSPSARQRRTPFQSDFQSDRTDRPYHRQMFGEESSGVFDATKNHTGRGPKGWKRSDDRIREDVCESLERDRHLDASEIDVMVKDGIVILSGSVENRPLKRHAEEIIEHLMGVKDVRNELSVDQSLFEQAKEAITGEAAERISRSEKPGTRH